MTFRTTEETIKALVRRMFYSSCSCGATVHQVSQVVDIRRNNDQKKPFAFVTFCRFATKGNAKKTKKQKQKQKKTEIGRQAKAFERFQVKSFD